MFSEVFFLSALQNFFIFAVENKIETHCGICCGNPLGSTLNDIAELNCVNFSL